MKDAKHTPGPWKEADYIIWPANHGDAQYPVHARKRGRIAVALTKPADARLIAAAPDLLAIARDFEQALSELGAFCECGEQNCRTTRLRAAIAKATGTTND